MSISLLGLTISAYDGTTATTVFSYYGSEADLELIAGMAAVLLPLLADLNGDEDQLVRAYDTRRRIISTAGTVRVENIHGPSTGTTSVPKGNYQLHTTANLQPYRLKRHLREADIPTAVLELSPSDKVLWIRNQEEFFYDAYKFTTSAFLQGVFTIAHHFNADYRNYIHGLPYDGLLNVLEVPEYGLVAPNISASEVPDLDDIEAEEVDDENILNPYERSDDIVTITSTSNSFSISSADEGNQEVYVV